MPGRATIATQGFPRCPTSPRSLRAPARHETPFTHWLWREPSGPNDGLVRRCRQGRDSRLPRQRAGAHTRGGHVRRTHPAASPSAGGRPAVHRGRLKEPHTLRQPATLARCSAAAARPARTTGCRNNQPPLTGNNHRHIHTHAALPAAPRLRARTSRRPSAGNDQPRDRSLTTVPDRNAAGRSPSTRPAPAATHAPRPCSHRQDQEPGTLQETPHHSAPQHSTARRLISAVTHAICLGKESRWALRVDRRQTVGGHLQALVRRAL
jgi:hypothetical protein